MLVRTLSVRLRRVGAVIFGVATVVVVVAVEFAGRGVAGAVALPLLASQSSSWCGTHTVSFVRAAAANAEALQDRRAKASRRRFFMERPVHGGRWGTIARIAAGCRAGPGPAGFPG